MIITHKISMDLTRRGVSPRISVVQGDENSRAVEVYLAANGCAWDVPGGTACVVRYKKPDGHGGVYSTMPDGSSAYSVNGNTVTVMLVPQVINVPGPVELSVAITEGSTIVGTFSFYVNVERDPSAGLTDSADYFSFSSLEEINTALLSLFAKTEMDESLKKSGLPADAAAVGAAVSQLSADIAGITPAQIGAAMAFVEKFTPAWAAINFAENDLLSIDLNGDFNTSSSLWCGNISTEDATQLVNSPITSGPFYAFRTVEKSPVGHFLVTLKEMYPVAGRVWSNMYDTNAKGFYGWRCNITVADFPPMNDGTEYMTLEYFHGKRVYTKACTVGVIPENGQKTIAHGSAATYVIRCLACADDGTSLPYVYPPTRVDVMATRTEIQIYAQNRGTEGGTAYVQIWYTKD